MVSTTIPEFNGNDVVIATYKKLSHGNIPARHRDEAGRLALAGGASLRFGLRRLGLDCS